MHCLKQLVLISVFCLSTIINLGAKNSSIMEHFGLIEISYAKVSTYRVPDKSTSAKSWVKRRQAPTIFKAIQQLLYEIPAEGYVWKDWNCNETITLEIMDGYLNMRKLYFNCGALASPKNNAYYASFSAKALSLYKLVANLQDTANAMIDSIHVNYADTNYYDFIVQTRIAADGSNRGPDRITPRFKDNNPDAYYFIYSKDGSKLTMEGRILPGIKYHNKCIRYFEKSSKPNSIASITHYNEGLKHGLEQHLKRNGEVNWQKEWHKGRVVP